MKEHDEFEQGVGNALRAIDPSADKFFAVVGFRRADGTLGAYYCAAPGKSGQTSLEQDAKVLGMFRKATVQFMEAYIKGHGLEGPILEEFMRVLGEVEGENSIGFQVEA